MEDVAGIPTLFLISSGIWWNNLRTSFLNVKVFEWFDPFYLSDLLKPALSLSSPPAIPYAIHFYHQLIFINISFWYLPVSWWVKVGAFLVMIALASFVYWFSYYIAICRTSQILIPPPSLRCCSTRFTLFHHTPVQHQEPLARWVCASGV